MKFSEMQAINAQQSNQKIKTEAAWKWNSPLLDGVKNRFNLTALPEKVVEQVKNIDTRVAKIFVCTFEKFNEKFPNKTTEDAICLVVDGKDPKTGSPYLYLYAPELNSYAKVAADKAQQQINVSRISTYFKESCGIEPSEKFMAFLSSLPADIPFSTSFDGSRIRVANLAKQECVKKYGNEEDEFFAVRYILYGIDTITIFVADLDYVSMFANKLVQRLQLKESLAHQISAALPHDTYYGIHTEVSNDFAEYAINMAWLLRAKPGMVVHDLLQGDVDVVPVTNSKKNALDLESKLPSAILAKNRVNVYLPPKDAE